MENARVIIIDDDPTIREDCRLNLEARNHVVVGEAASVAHAEVLIEGLGSDGLDIAVVDGNLSRHSEGGVDGERLAALIHQKLPGVTVVGASMDGEVRGADMNVPKGDAWALDALVTQLKRA
jgi:DNA-binding NtrC family response regulator